MHHVKPVDLDPKPSGTWLYTQAVPEPQDPQFNCSVGKFQLSAVARIWHSTGAMGKEAEKFHKRLAALISEKRMTPYSDCMSYLRRKLSFCLLRTVLAALRVYRGKAAKTDDCNMDINLLHLNEVVRY